MSIEPPQSFKEVAAVFVHGIFGDDSTWDQLFAVLSRNPLVQRSVELLPFCYDSSKFQWNPLRRIPELSEVAQTLSTFIQEHAHAQRYNKVILIGHSQGGLIIQRFLADTIKRGEGLSLAAIRRIVLIATPNTGSQVLLSLRWGLGKLFLWYHPQERSLRPLNTELDEIRRLIIGQVLYAPILTNSSCPIPFDVYAGQSDGIVPPGSARWVFPNAATLPGDHFSIIRPATADAPICSALCKAFRAVIDSILPDDLRVRTEPIDTRRTADIEAVLAIHYREFSPSSQMRKRDFRYWIENYESQWGIRLSVLTARVNDEIKGFVMFHEMQPAIVIDYIAADTVPTLGNHLLLSKLVARIEERAQELDRPVIFEVENPFVQINNCKRARARIRNFERFGARVIGGISYFGPDMNSVISPGTEQPCLLMYSRLGKMPDSLSRIEVQEIIECMYKRWLGNWFSRTHDMCKLDSYLEALCQRVYASIPDECPLRKLDDLNTRDNAQK